MKCCIISNLASSLSSSNTCFLFLSHLCILQEFWQIVLQQLNLISFISISFRKKSIYQFDIFKLSIPCKHFHCVICISLQTPKVWLVVPGSVIFTLSLSVSPFIIIRYPVIRLPPLSARAFHLTFSELAWKSSTDDAMKAGLVPLQTCKEKLELSLFHNHQSLRK